MSEPPVMKALRDVYEDGVDARNRIAELEAALAVAQRRFELLAVVSDEMINGAKPSVGAAECAAAIGHQK